MFLAQSAGKLSPLRSKSSKPEQPDMHAPNGENMTNRTAQRRPIGMASTSRASNQTIDHSQPQFAMLLKRSAYV